MFHILEGLAIFMMDARCQKDFVSLQSEEAVHDNPGPEAVCKAVNHSSSACCAGSFMLRAVRV